MILISDMIGEVQSFIERGGDVLTLIFIVTCLMWVLILERIFYFRIIFPKHSHQIINDWHKRANKATPYTKQIQRLEISEVSSKLRHSLAMIKTLIALCPLLGLLGTVTGMMEVFDVMAMVGSGNARAMASGITKATIPTMAGMVAALSGVYFSARFDTILKKEVVQFADRLGKNGGDPCVAE